MKKVILLVLALLTMPVVAKSNFITELGITVPVSTSSIRDYIASRGVKALPFTGGYGNGVVVGRHAPIGKHATVGLLFGANAFIVSDSSGTNQIYQANLYATGRIYFSESWRGGLFVELGSGPELSVVKLATESLVYQINITARFGLGYNYKFSDDVTIGASFLIAPSLTSGSYLDGAKVSVGMLW